MTESPSQALACHSAQLRAASRDREELTRGDRWLAVNAQRATVRWVRFQCQYVATISSLTRTACGFGHDHISAIDDALDRWEEGIS